MECHAGSRPTMRVIGQEAEQRFSALMHFQVYAATAVVTE